MTFKRQNDIGGSRDPAFMVPVDPTDVERTYWERYVDVIRTALGEDVITVDEMRRGMEEMDPTLYGKLAFFERRVESISNILVEKGVVDRAELNAAIKDLLENGIDGDGA